MESKFGRPKKCYEKLDPIDVWELEKVAEWKKAGRLSETGYLRVNADFKQIPHTVWDIKLAFPEFNAEQIFELYRMLKGEDPIRDQIFTEA